MIGGGAGNIISTTELASLERPGRRGGAQLVGLGIRVEAISSGSAREGEGRWKRNEGKEREQLRVR